MNIAYQHGFVTFLEEPPQPAAAAGDSKTRDSRAPDPEAQLSHDESQSHADNGDGIDGEQQQQHQPTGEYSSQEQQQQDQQQQQPNSLDRVESVDLDDDGEALLNDTELTQSTNWEPGSNEESINELHEYFSHFYSMRRIVKQAFHEIKEACSGLYGLLESSADADRSADRWISAGEEATIMNLLKADPVIIVLGCKGCGKSSIINGILGQDILPSSASMLRHSSNGISHLRFHETGFVKLQRSPNEMPLQADSDQKLSLQVRHFVEQRMSDEERAAWAALDNCILEIGCSNPILRTRVSFLEIPGDCFDPRIRDRLLRQLMLSSNQTVVYVIDGNKGLGNSDREFLFFLKASIPKIKIFYIINKVDYDPEAEEMDCESDESDVADADASEPTEKFHRSGAETQRRKRRLVESQLQQYHLAEPGAVFPLSILRQKFPLEGNFGGIAETNSAYREEYQQMVSALRSSLLEAGRSSMQLALSTLFLVAVRTFDAFTRDTSGDGGDGDRQAEQQASKEKIKQSFQDTCKNFDQVKQDFFKYLQDVHREKQEAIVGECRKLEFGPLRLYSRIRNNEVEQQYRDQINNYVLHLLNVEIRDRLEERIELLRQQLSQEVEKLKQVFCDSSRGRPASPWEDLIRSHADEIIAGIVKLNFSVEWKAESGFLKWVKKLWSSKKQQSRSRALSPNSADWKSEVAGDFYGSINLHAVVKKMFAGVDIALRQAEAALLNLAHSRGKHAERLQKLLAKENDDARGIWQRVQLCLVTAEALKTTQSCQLLPSASIGHQLTATRLGRQCRLQRQYAAFAPTEESRVAVTVTPIWSSACDAASVGEWAQKLGGALNHHLLKADSLRDCRAVAVTLLLTFSDKYELCLLHAAFDSSLADTIQPPQVAQPSTKLQAFYLMDSLLALWGLCCDQQDLQFSLRLPHIKTWQKQHAVYDLLETPIRQPKKGHSIGKLLLLGKSSEVERKEKSEEELNNVLELMFMILIRRTQDFARSSEFQRIDEQDQPDDRRRQLLKHLKQLHAGVDRAELVDRLPADAIANCWYVAPTTLKRERMGDFVQRGLAEEQRQK